MKKRLLSMVLALVLVLAALPFTFASAETQTTEDGFEYEINDGEARITKYIGNATELVIPDTLGGCPVTTIGDQAFINCNDLTSVIIPNSVTVIENDAFEYCKALVSITIPDSVTTIGDYAFFDCTVLASITIGNGVTTIGADAFESTAYYNDNSNWEDSVLYIGKYLLKGNNAVSGEYSIREGTKIIGEEAFEYCKNLTSIILPDSVAFIEDDAFSGCTSLASIAIPDSVISIGKSAFSSCISLTEITIPESVTTIGDYAFSGCTSLASIAIPKSVTTIGDCAFRYCEKLSTIYITDMAAWCKIEFQGNFSNPLYYAEEFCLNGQMVTDLVIPDGVTYINNYTFYYFNSLTSVAIPGSVTTIGDYAFSGCTALASVTIPDSVTAIGEFTFENCKNLTNVIIGNSVIDIGVNAFSGCGNLTEVYIKDISAWCTIRFENARSNPLCYATKLYLNKEMLTKLQIPDGVTSIENYAFYNFSGLTDVIIGNDVVNIATDVFTDCINLTNVIIGNSVIDIGVNAFSGCGNLTDIVMPKSVNKIDDYAFSGCKKLENVWYTGSTSDREAIQIDSFGNGNSSLTKAIWHYDICSGEHLFSNDCDVSCDVCEWIRSVDTDHTYANACDISCNVCGANREITHDYVDATCTEPKTCKVCGETEGDALGHHYEQGKCTRCQADDPDYTKPDQPVDPVEPTVSFTVKEDGGGVIILGYTGEETNVVIPESINGKTVVGIADGAFKGMDTIASVGIPDSVVSIADNAFEGCNGSLKLLGGEGSLAQTFAQNKGYHFQVIGQSEPNQPETPTDVVVFGDLDGDNKINAKDALNVLKIAVGKLSATDDQKAAADVNDDGQINAKDALEILKHSVGKPSALDKKSA